LAGPFPDGRWRQTLPLVERVMIQPQSLVNSRYRVVRRLGDGGMAIVYLGHDLLLGRDVAIKTLRPQFAADPAFRARFEREARAAASLSHPNIIDVYDVGEDDGVPFIVMELVRGQTLKQIIAADAPFHPDDIAELMQQVGAALDDAHARGYVHRDVKPGNILIDEHGRARVVDFGIAKGLADADLTEAGGGMGTAGYLSPEQAAGLMATPASDIYSAGVVAFEMLTGQLPFRAETPVGLAMRHLHDPPPPPSDVSPGIPPQVDAVVMRALDKDPTRRWPSVGALARALRDWRDVDVVVDNHADFDAPMPRGRGSLAPTIVVVILILGALAALLWSGFRGLPLTGDDSPPVIVPSEPIITGGLEDEPEADSIIDPTGAIFATDGVAAPETAPAPTIAPAGQEAVIVPNLQGLTIAGVTQALLPLGLRIAQDQPVYSNSVPLNAVVAQQPQPGTTVAPGETIFVSLSRGPSPFIGEAQP
jgi:serine/threonine-protein kinase